MGLFLVEQVESIVMQMVKTGFFGSSQALAVERIISGWILDNVDRLAAFGIEVPRINVKTRRK